MTQLPKRHAQGITSVRLRLINVFRDAQFGDSFGKFVLKFQSKAAVVMKSWVSGIESKGSGKFRNRRSEIGFLQIGGTEIALVGGVRRMDLKSGTKSRNSAIAVSGLQQGQSQIILRFSALRPQTKQFTKCGSGIRGIPDTLESLAQQIQNVGLRSLGFKGGLKRDRKSTRLNASHRT